LNRGEIWDVEWPAYGKRPAVVVTRQVAIPFLTNVTVAIVTSRVRGLPTEVAVGERQGLARESVINCDNLLTVATSALVRRRGALGPAELERLRSALQIALELD
jgi:mRNA interferase MazF